MFKENFEKPSESPEESEVTESKVREMKMAFASFLYLFMLVWMKKKS